MKAEYKTGTMRLSRKPLKLETQHGKEISVNQFGEIQPSEILVTEMFDGKNWVEINES